MNKLDIKELQNRLDAISEGQLNEDLIDAGSPLEDILEMNLFMDMLNVNPEDCPAGSDEMANVNSDREFKGLDYLVTRDLCAKYKPIAMQLAKQIQAQADRELTEDEADMLNEVWYEASDLYQNGDDSELARIYDEQIQLIKQLLSSANESQVNEYYVKSAEDVLNTYPLFSYRKSNPSVDTLYKSFQKWLATGNELTPDQIEALDQAAEEVEYIEPENKEEMKEMLKKQYKVLSDIIKGNKTESVEKVNEYYVKSAKDVLNTLPAFAYRASDPVDDQPEDKMYTAAVGDRAEMLYNKLRKWLAAGNDFSPEEIEALDQAASGPEFIGLRGDADDQDVIDMLNSGLDTLEDIIGDKTESVQEGDAELAELKDIMGRSGVMGFSA